MSPSGSLVAYAPRPDATPAAELSALAGVYRFVLDCRAKKEAAGPRQAGDLEDARERIKDARTRHHST